MTDEPSLKPVVWMGSSRKDIREFPERVQDHIGYALYVAQHGGRHQDVKTLTGFGGAGVLEIVADHRAIHSVPCTRSAMVMRYMCCTPSRKNQRLDARRRKGILN